MDKAFDVIVIGELNVDIIMNHINGYPEIGKEKISDNMSVTLGSSSAIFASNLSSLGAKVAFVGKTGTDSFSEVVMQSLQERGVDTSHIIRTPDFNTGATIVLNYGQDRAMITYPGAMNELKPADIDYDLIKTGRHLHFSSYFLQPGIGSGITSIFKKAKDLGLTTSLDPQWDPDEKWDLDLKALLPVTDVFLPNIKELQSLTHKGNLDDALASVKTFCRNIVIKHGSDGAYLWDGQSLSHQPAFINHDVVDCIGAGDSFNAGFILKFVQQQPLAKCMEYGALTGAISTTAAGGTSAFKSHKEISGIASLKFNYTF
ncbi:MAG TPA: carbohydrate kinase family protein [Bacteroidales bacterium]|nr:carbohydrate kinase family protein [Bacteroidales bacterium]